MGEPPLHCNGCWTKTQNKAFKTSCDHCFCEQCAEQLFSDRRRRCSVCNTDVVNVLEFQIVGAPILDDQLTDVRSTLQAIACANGACSLDPWISNLHRFERIQLSLWGSRQGQASLDSLREAEERERVLSERELQSRQFVASLEHECEQLRKERDSAQRGVQDLQTALDERSRQADNWRAMYEALKSGGRVTVPSTSTGGGGPMRSLPPPPVSKLMRSSENMFSNEVRALPPFPGPDSGRFRSNSIVSGDSGNSDFRSFPTRSNSLPQRPPTRDSLTSLLNRSIAPRTSSTVYQPRTSLGPPPAPMMSEPVRSTFFAPASLRAVSPSIQPMGGGIPTRTQNGMLY